MSSALNDNDPPTDTFPMRSRLGKSNEKPVVSAPLFCEGPVMSSLPVISRSVRLFSRPGVILLLFAYVKLTKTLPLIVSTPVMSISPWTSTNSRFRAIDRHDVKEAMSPAFLIVAVTFPSHSFASSASCKYPTWVYQCNDGMPYVLVLSRLERQLILP